MEAGLTCRVSYRLRNLVRPEGPKIEKEVGSWACMARKALRNVLRGARECRPFPIRMTNEGHFRRSKFGKPSFLVSGQVNRSVRCPPWRTSPSVGCGGRSTTMVVRVRTERPRTMEAVHERPRASGAEIVALVPSVRVNTVVLGMRRRTAPCLARGIRPIPRSLNGSRGIMRGGVFRPLPTRHCRPKRR